MKTEPKILGDHVIYGTWDAETDSQVLVFYHPNGISADVFVMGGTDLGCFDSGGGIACYVEGTSAKEVEAAWKAAESDAEFHECMRDICKDVP